MLLYAALYLTGYDLSLDDLRQFRQWGPHAGHSEHGLTPERRGYHRPARPGCGNAVGMALAEAHLAQLFNRPGHTVVDHCTYFLASDGDLMEGVSHEACSLAGHLKLGRLIGIYDDNPHHHRRQDRSHVLGRYGEAVRELRLARGARRRRE